MDRLAIKAMPGLGQLDLALEAMAALQKDPLASLGFELPSIVGNQPGDTPTVFFIRAGTVAYYAGAALKDRLNATDVLDLALRGTAQDAPMPWATIQVDLRAKRTQIKADFKTWLSQVDLLLSPPKEKRKRRKSVKLTPTKRDYTKQKVFDGWIESEYLPYFDLTLYAKLRERVIPDDVMVELLRRYDPDAAEADRLNAPERSLELFTTGTVHAMWRQREALAAPEASVPASTSAAKSATPKTRQTPPESN